MKVKMIQSPAEVDTLTPFYVDKLLWGTKSIPKTYGYLGFIPEDGFCLKMVCEEKNPLCTYTRNTDPVYRDSAIEAFMQFEPQRERAGSPIYINLEANANGALLASYGKERNYRSHFSKEAYQAFDCRADVKEDFWTLLLRIPVHVLEEIYGPLHLGEGSRFFCNFYKISETKEVEHYASYALIRSEIPSFHRPEFFETAVITKNTE